MMIQKDGRMVDSEGSTRNLRLVLILILISIRNLRLRNSTGTHPEEIERYM